MDWVVWIIVMFYQLFWTLILTAPIHCRASIAEQVMQCYILQIWWRNKLIYILDGPEDEHIFKQLSFLGELFL